MCGEAALGCGGGESGAEGEAETALGARVVGEELYAPAEGGASRVVAGDDEAEDLAVWSADCGVSRLI